MPNQLFKAYATKMHINQETKIGRIIHVSQSKYQVLNEDEDMFIGVLKGYFEEDQRPIIGDYVSYLQQTDFVLILEVLPRFSIIQKQSSYDAHFVQGMAANVDYLFICISANENFSMNRLERYLYVFNQSTFETILVLTKSDLADSIEDYISQVKAVYPDLMIIATGLGDDVEDAFKFLIHQQATSIFIGSSGVGKSTLLNRLGQFDIAKVNEITQKTSKGKHTTTASKLYLLDKYGYMIDSPGIKSIGVWQSDEGSTSFSEIEQLAKQCFYNDCKHTNEPGCAVIQALQTGELSDQRYQNYVKLQKENRYMQTKIHNLDLKEKKSKSKINAKAKRVAKRK